jgi:hypothetical protein
MNAKNRMRIQHQTTNHENHATRHTCKGCAYRKVFAVIQTQNGVFYTQSGVVATASKVYILLND